MQSAKAVLEMNMLYLKDKDIWRRAYKNQLKEYPAYWHSRVHVVWGVCVHVCVVCA